MRVPLRKRCLCALSVAACSLAAAAQAAQAPTPPADEVQLRVYAGDSCIVSDEPFFIPEEQVPGADRPKIFPLVGLVIGKLAQLFINHEIQAAADYIKAGAVRKDTRYAMTRQMNLYRAEFDPVPTLRINAVLGCITIVAATFDPEPVSCTERYVPKELASESRGQPQSQWKTSRKEGSLENQLRRANICVPDGKARAVYEARFELSPDGTAYRLRDAGYRIESLLTTRDKRATRTALYALKITSPGVSDQEVLSSAWVDLGTVAAGTRSSGSGGDAGAPWFRVPGLSIDARRSYEQQTKTQQEAMGEIQALERALTRNRRVRAGLDERIGSVAPDVGEALKQERTRLAVQYEEQSVELEARRAEYQDLPHAALEFMPVTIEVGVTETESEKQAQLVLAELIGSNRDMVGSAAGHAAEELVSRSIAKTVAAQPRAPHAGDNLQRARELYYDAWVEAQTSASGDANEEVRRRLAAAKEDYNAARRSLGLELIK